VPAPDFKLVDKDLGDKTLADFAGKKAAQHRAEPRHAVCATSTRKFNESFAGRDDVVCLVVSADLPFAQGRFCQAEGIDNVQTLSMMRSRNFAKDYGVLIEDGPLAGITARAIVGLDPRTTRCLHRAGPEIGEEPDYDAALAALG
jgi:thiol peroxidase